MSSFPQFSRSPRVSGARSGPAVILASLLIAGFTGCGGGGAAGSSSDSGGMNNTTSTATPPADPAYYNVPSTTLGPTVTAGNVSFAYWNPGASSVTVNLYSKWNDPLSAPAATVAMAKDANGVWTSAAVGITTALFYVYNVNGTYMLDPYARSMAQWVHTASASISGDSIGKGAILNPNDVLPDGGWTPYAGSSYYYDGSAMKAPGGATASYGYGSARDAIIYEASVRDLTVSSALTGFQSGHPWGTYKGMIDILPHIQKLGVTHIQLLCPLENYTYDQTRTGQRELDSAKTSGANYNWGYDPQNYFTPSGMFSATPTDPAARVQELKTLINEIHKQGMGVILDVVYNHTANNNVLADSGLLSYYYRSTSNNGAGSRDVKTENKMTRKLIVDSIVQWVSAYKVDGFRFDLMGDLDYQTVLAAYAAAHDLNPKTLFLGEGWTGFYAGSSTDYLGASTGGADQSNAAQFKGKNIAMFSDSYRQIFKNGYPSDGAQAFLSNTGQAPAALFSNVQGIPSNSFAPGSSNGVVNYLTCHDNLCLYDALSMATGASKANDSVILQRAKIGYAILLTSQGVAFLHAGDEMFRSKETTAAAGAANTKSSAGRVYVDNSYNASDAINQVDWSKVYTSSPISAGFSNYATSQPGYQLYAYTQGLIALRKASNAFRLPDTAVASNVTALTPVVTGTTTLAFGYKAVATDGSGTYFVFHNADQTAQTWNLATPLGSAKLLADGTSAGTTAIANSSTVTLSPGGVTVTLAPLTSAIFKQ